MIGQTLSHYRILEKLIGGRMRAVFKAKNTRLNRLIAPQGFSIGEWLISGKNETRTLATDLQAAG
jgi:hypothetical protein